MFLRICLLLVALLPLQTLAQPAGKITFLEGRAKILRDTQALSAAPGVVVEAADILETANPGFALIEFDDESIIALGPDSRILLRPRKGEASEILLLNGWLKAQSQLADGPAGWQLRSRALSTSWNTASLIFHAQESGAEIFVENGAAKAGPSDAGGLAATLSPARAGQFVTRKGTAAPSTQPRASEAFLQAMPAPFRDRLPNRLARFKERPVTARALGTPNYADMADWFATPKSWRNLFVKRFESRLSDPDFRREVEAHIRLHPEWDRILHPPRKPQE